MAGGGSTFQIQLKQAVSGDVWLDLWRSGIRIMQLKYVRKTETILEYASDKREDSLAREVFQQILPSKDSIVFAKKLAEQVVGKDSVSRSTEQGIAVMVGVNRDTLETEALRIMVRSGFPIDRFVSQESGRFIGLSRDSIHIKVNVLVGLKLIDSDTNALFPPPPVRIVSKVKISDRLSAGGPAVGVSGKFEATGKIVTMAAKVFQDSIDVSSEFLIPQIDLTTRPKVLDLGGGLLVAAKATAAPGTYRLEVVVMDADDHLAKAVVEFQVLPAADTMGPAIEIRSPTPNTILENDVATISVQAKVEDPSGIDSVWVSDKLASFADGIWSVESLEIPVTDIGFVIVVRAVDRNGNSASKDVLVGRRAKLDPGAPSGTVLFPRPSEFFPFDSSSVEVRWKVLDPRASVVSAAIGGGPAKEDGEGIWTRRVELPASGVLTTIPLVAVNAKGDTVTGFVQATRQADTKGPVIQIKSPVDGTVFAYDAQSVLVKVATADPSGVDSVKIDGKPAESVGTEYAYSMALEAGKEVVIRVQAWDKLKNRSFDSIKVTRKGPPDTTAPRLRLLGPASGTELSMDTKTAILRWLVTDLFGLVDADVTIDGKVAKRSADTFSLEVAAPAPGKEESHRIDVKNIKGVANFETMTLKRAKDVVAPKLVRVDSGRTVPFETEKATVSWKVTDNYLLGSVSVAGKVVTGVDGLYSQEVALATGDNRVAIVATDSANNSSTDTVIVHRTWKDTSKPLVVRQSGTEPKNVPFATTEFTASWKVTDNALSTVTINGAVITSTDGIYSLKVTLAQAQTPIKIVAKDAANNSKMDSITITKSDDLVDPVVARLPGTKDTTVPYATSTYALGWEVIDENGVVSVSVNGAPATKNGDNYRLAVSLSKVGLNEFLMVAKDVAGNDVWDTIRIHRAYHDSVAPQRVRGVNAKDTTVPYGTAKYTLSWTVTDNDLVKSVTIGGGIASVTGNVYSREVDLVAGSNKFGMLSIDTAGNKTTDTVTIKVADDSAPPLIAREVGTKDSVVAYGATSITLKWKVTDDAGVSSVKVNGVLVTSASGIYTWNATGLSIGPNVFRIVAVDVVNKSNSDSLVITRAWKDSLSPVVSRQVGTGPVRVASTIDTATLSWRVSDTLLKEVRLNDTALAGQAGVFTKTIHLSVGSNPVVLVAEDQAGNLTRDTFTIFRNEPPRYGLLPYPEIVGRYPGSDPSLDPFLKAAWVKWKADFMANGIVMAAMPSETNQMTSDGQAYGMLLAVWFNDQTAFNKILDAANTNFWNTACGSGGWYGWKLPGAKSGCTGDGSFSANADMGIAGALIFASALQEKGYWSGSNCKAMAITRIKSVWNNMIDKGSNYRVNTWSGAGDGARNPSYHMPAWYSVFKEFAAVNGLTGMDWDAATKGAHDLFAVQPFSSAGMVRNYSTGTGGVAAGGVSTPSGADMGFDAILVPWTQALANIWHHDIRAGTWCTKVWSGGVVSPERAGLYKLSSAPALWGWMSGEYESVMSMGMWGACAVAVRDSSVEAKDAAESLGKTMIDALRSDASFLVTNKNWYAQTYALLGTLAITGRAWNVWGDLNGTCSPCGP